MKSGKKESETKSETPSVAGFEVPIIPQIHNRLLQAIKSEGCSLNMRDWHTCETTHCRAGWICEIGGEKGKALEKATNSEFAAMMIYKVSSPIRVSPVRFYESNEVAMRDIERCAQEEQATAANSPNDQQT